MPIAYHVVMGFYGFWLPNDERGSWSTYVGSRTLYRFGAATKTSTRQSVAHQPFDRARRDEMRAALKFPIVQLDGTQAAAIGAGFGEQLRHSKFVIHACAILPQHVHLVLAHVPYDVTQAANLLKGSATRVLRSRSLDPLAGKRSIWAHDAWYVYLDTEEDVRSAVRYVEANPMREGKRRQHWRYVTALGA